VDGRQARRSSATRGHGLRLSLAGTGDAVDLRTLEVRPAGGKASVPVTAGALTPPQDPFERFAFLQLLRDLASSPDAEVSFSLGTATLTIREAPGFAASMRAAEGGVQGVPLGFSAGPFLLDVLPGG